MSNREIMEYDVVIVGAGPSGLSAAIKLKQLSKEADKDLSVCVVEKGSEVGAHILSGAVIETKALDELIPDWKTRNCPLKTKANEDKFLYLTKTKSYQLPTPPQMHNEGNYIISLSDFTKWLAEQAELLEVEIYPGFSASEVLFNDKNKVIGIATCDMGRLKDGSEGPNFEQGIELHSKQTIFSEGCRGHLGKTLIQKFNLDAESSPQTYGIGIKELWEILPENSNPGNILHTTGWPLKSDTYGGSFLYHLDKNKISIGFVIGLDYKNPYLSPYMEFQRFKHHPDIKKILEGGRRINYGARALNEGGVQSLPKLTFPGGMLVGCEAGFLNVPKIKGTHLAMKSGMIAASSIFENIDINEEISNYEDEIKNSWIWSELYEVRNIRPSFKWGFWKAIVYSAIDTYIFRGKAPWTLDHHGTDHESLENKNKHEKINYPKPDNVISFDRLTNVSFSGTNHEENQPCHLTLKNEEVPIKTNLELYDNPETLYCPAGVYEIVMNDNKPKLQINAQNCVHCKTCDIKDPTQNINWITPQGGGGPNYQGM
ncbi:electron transfer flavoprotein-ubiquinone oxidoreductase [bacterium]|jgi:electron-transferring-flavoprotein dehydrogenase|nr:electron transfer flavoprotein-ubiquinone oxidoreductase [bacterium]